MKVGHIVAYELLPDDFPLLTGEGLTLRELAEEDLPAWFMRLSDAEAAALAGDPVATSMQDVRDGLAYHHSAFRAKEGIRWAIVPDDVGSSVGSIGFGRLDAENRTAEIGLAIGRAYWNQNIATRAVHLAVAYGFGPLGLQRIEALVRSDNAASLRVLEKNGFEREGLLRSYRVINGVRWDFALYSVLHIPRS